jgi:hypothetical protein
MHRLPQVAAPLYVQPEIGAVAEHSRRDESRRGRHVAAIVAQFVDVLALHAHRLSQAGLGQAQRLQELSTKISPTVAGLRFVVSMAVQPFSISIHR